MELQDSKDIQEFYEGNLPDEVLESLSEEDLAELADSNGAAV